MYGARCGQPRSASRSATKRWSHKGLPPERRVSQLPAPAKPPGRPSVGGWHDAGDGIGKYIHQRRLRGGDDADRLGALPATLAALSIDADPGARRTALPHYLAEVKWELDWLLTTQGDDGGVSPTR